MKNYLVILEKSETSYAAYVPDLPGCVAFGETRAEVEKQIREGMAFHVEGMRLNGTAVPEPTTEVLTMSVAPISMNRTCALRRSSRRGRRV